MTRPIHVFALSVALFALFPVADAGAVPVSDALPCMIAIDPCVVPPPVIVRPWTPPPPPMVVVRPWNPPPPRVYVRAWTPPPPPVTSYAVPPPARVFVRPIVVTPPVAPAVVVTEPQPEPVTAVDEDGGTIDDRGEGVRAARRVVVGGGFGGLMLAGHDSSTLSSSFSLHLGVALRQASVGVRIDMAPDAVEVADGSGGLAPASYTIGGLGFGYHFNADSLIHPVVGASLELHALDPEGAKATFGFGLGARAGLEMEYPLDSGSLGIGVDISGHRRFGDAETMAVPPTAVAFGGTIDYRF